MQSYYKNLARTKENPPASTWEPDFSKSRILIERFYKDQDDFRDALAKRVEFEIQQIRSAHTKFEIDDSNDEINEHRIYKEEFTPNGTTRYNFNDEDTDDDVSKRTLDISTSAISDISPINSPRSKVEMIILQPLFPPVSDIENQIAKLETEMNLEVLENAMMNLKPFEMQIENNQRELMMEQVEDYSATLIDFTSLENDHNEITERVFEENERVIEQSLQDREKFLSEYASSVDFSKCRVVGLERNTLKRKMDGWVEIRDSRGDLIYEPDCRVEIFHNERKINPHDEKNGYWYFVLEVKDGVNVLQVIVNGEALQKIEFEPLRFEGVHFDGKDHDGMFYCKLMTSKKVPYYSEGILEIAGVEEGSQGSVVHISFEKSTNRQFPHHYAFKLSENIKKIEIMPVGDSYFQPREFLIDRTKPEPKKETTPVKEESKASPLKSMPQKELEFTEKSQKEGEESQDDAGYELKIEKVPKAYTPTSYVEYQKKIQTLGVVTDQIAEYIEQEGKSKSEKSDLGLAAFRLKGDINVLIGQTTNTRSAMHQKIGKLKHFIQSTIENENFFLYILLVISEKIVEQAKLQVSRTKNTAFAYAAIVVGLSQQYPAFLEIFLGVITKKCPWTVPIYLARGKDQSEEDYLLELGFDRVKSTGPELIKKADYAERMCGVITLYAAVLQWPQIRFDHPYGIENGWSWVAKLLNMQTNEYSALFLNEFLQTGGFALRERYKLQFVKLMKFIKEDFLKRLPTKSDFSSAPAMLKQYIEYCESNKEFTPTEPEGRHLEN